MKKKTAIIVMMLFYMFTTCGIYIGFHYCNGKLKSVSFKSSEKEKGCCCGKKGKKGKKDCCKNKTVYIKIKDNQKLVDQLKPICPPEKIVPFANNFGLNLNYLPALPEVLLPTYHGPPPLISADQLYIRHGALLI